MKIEETFKVGIREIGLKNEMTNYGFLAFLEDLATYHSNAVGYGVKDIPINKGAWLLMDWQLEVIKRPAFSDVIKVKTYAVYQEKPSFQCFRNFEVYDDDSNLIATATSKWIFFNFELKKITKIDLNMMKLFNPEGDISESESKISKLKEPSTYQNTFKYTVTRRDLDINKHMNNLNYVKIAYESLPEEVFQNNEPNNLRVMYKHQIKLGENIKCLYSYENNKHIIVIKSEDEKTLHSIVELW